MWTSNNMWTSNLKTALSISKMDKFIAKKKKENEELLKLLEKQMLIDERKEKLEKLEKENNTNETN